MAMNGVYRDPDFHEEEQGWRMCIRSEAFGTFYGLNPEYHAHVFSKQNCGGKSISPLDFHPF